MPLDNVREVSERLNAHGDVLSPFDEVECRAVAQWYHAQGIKTIAICFMNAYADGKHERRAREILKQEHPNCLVAISSETLPEYREYERAVTTCMSAMLMPLLGTYVAKIKSHLLDLRITAPLYIMKSGGGASRAELTIEQPVHTALSGPAAAVAGSAWIGRNTGIPSLITFDMGGTSTDVALIENGRPAMVSEVEVDVYPIRTPAIDVVTVGAGGGSVAWLAPGDRLRVGPKSAGADPGPVCYGLGGHEPTITDANLLLGRLPVRLAGGAVTLDRRLAQDALAKFGERLGLSAVEMACGIIDIGEMNMADAIRQVSVQKGRDPRLFTLAAGGGAGPLHACRLAEIIGILRVLIPPAPGIGCALGALVSDAREDFVMTNIHREEDADIARLSANFAELERRASEALARQGFVGGEAVIQRSADLRYRGMRSELTVPITSVRLDTSAIKAMFDGLHDVHEQAYGYAYRNVQQVEVVNLRVTGIGRLQRLTPFAGMAGKGAASSAVASHRQVYFAPMGFVDTPIYNRIHLSVGMEFDGQAIIEQYDSTIVILPGQRVSVDAHGNLIVATVSAQTTPSGKAQQVAVV